MKAFKRGIILLLLLRNTQVSLYSFLMNRSGHIGCTKRTTACYEVSRSSSPLVKYGLFRTISCLISLISSSYLICIVVYIFVSWLILCMLHIHPYRNVMHLYCKKRNWHYVVIRSCLAMLWSVKSKPLMRPLHLPLLQSCGCWRKAARCLKAHRCQHHMTLLIM